MAEAESGGDTRSKVRGIEAPLYQAIQDLKLAEIDIEFPFEGKLAYQCSWTSGYSSRVVAEYRRFLYLTQVSKTPIAPSDAIDQAWHLHLLQTHFYWDVMCTGLFGKALHHTPTLSGSDGRDADISRYNNVLREYKEIFLQDPPVDIWPSAAQRFSNERRRTENSLGSEITFSTQVSNLVAVATTLIVGTFVYFSKSFIPQSAIHEDQTPFLFGLTIIYFAVIVIVSRLGEATAKPADLDPYEAAYLTGGVNHLVNTALIRLVDLNLVTFVTNGKTGDSGTAECKLVIPDRPSPIVLDACEQAVFKELSANHGTWTLIKLSANTSSTISRIKTRLAQAGLVTHYGEVSVYDFILGLIAAISTVLFAILFDVPNEMPVGVFLLIGFGLGPMFIPAYFIFLLFGNERKTRDGIASLKAARQSVETGRRFTVHSGPRNYSKVSLAMEFAVLGSEAVINDKRFYGINYLEGSMATTAHSDDKAGCGDNIPKCG
jgi:uncharacterized protein (TIGR04222 family)